MSDRMNVVVPVHYQKDGAEKTTWKQVGSAWFREKLSGYSVKLDFPVGVTEFLIVPPKEHDQGHGGGGF